jgi:OFA family oxalate/formate antiporter-like MFS transporter
MLYTAKGTAALLVPFSSMLTAMTGNWHAVFVVASIMNAVAAIMAWFVLRPMRRAELAKASIEPVSTPAPHAGLGQRLAA